MTAPIVLPPLAWLPSPNFSTRAGTPTDLLVLHETAGSYAGAVSWLRNPAADASAHVVLREDGDQAAQLVRYRDKAWTQAFYNPRAVSLELANTSTKGYATEHQFRVGARIVAFWCHLFSIPPRFARKGVGRGLCRHLDLGAAGGGHTSCGPDALDWGRFLVYVADELERGDFLASWGKP